MNITIAHRIICLIIYILPWSDTLIFGKYLFSQFPTLSLLSLPAIPLKILEQSIPFGGFIIFLGLYIFIIRSEKMPYFIRFNSMQSILLKIILTLLSYALGVIIAPINNDFININVSNTIFILATGVILYCMSACIQGKEAEIPGISNAAKMQI